MPKGYWLARIDVRNPEAYEGYKALASAATAEYGARYLVRGGRQQVTEGASRSRTVIIEFPSYEAALACYNGPYRAAAALRRANAESDFLIVEGAEP